MNITDVAIGHEVPKETWLEIANALEILAPIFARQLRSMSIERGGSHEESETLENKLTTSEFAALLDGRNCGEELSYNDVERAKRSGLVIASLASHEIYGYNVKHMILRGAINGTYRKYEPPRDDELHFDKSGLFINRCDNHKCPYAENERKNCKIVRLEWCDDYPEWRFITDMPHAPFAIYSNGKPFCRGLVFEFAALSD